MNPHRKLVFGFCENLNVEPTPKSTKPPVPLKGENATN
jgi:hypothetical protein